MRRATAIVLVVLVLKVLAREPASIAKSPAVTGSGKITKVETDSEDEAPAEKAENPPWGKFGLVRTSNIPSSPLSKIWRRSIDIESGPVWNSSASSTGQVSGSESSSPAKFKPAANKLFRTFTQVQEVMQTSVQASDRLAVAKAVFNLINNIIGSGVLSLAAGLAAIGGEPALLLPAALVVVLMGLFSSYTFFAIGKQCGIYNAFTYNQVWARCISKRSAFVVMAAAVVNSVFTCLSFEIMIGDWFSALAKGGDLGPVLQSSALATDRKTWILSFAAVILYPLCSLQKLGALAYTSLLGVLGVLYTMTFMMIRYFDGSYRPGGALYKDISIKPAFGIKGINFFSALKLFLSRSGAFVLMAMCGQAYNAHLNAPFYYDETGGDSAKFGLIVILGFGIAIMLNLVFLIFGFLTFGSSSAGLILDSYAHRDQLASIGRILFGSQVVFTHPLVFAGLKPVVRQMMLRFRLMRDGALLNQVVTIFPLIAITTTSVLISQAGLVNAICGAICGSLMEYILPSLMYLFGSCPDGKNTIGKVGNAGLLVFGCLMGVLGVVVSTHDLGTAPTPAPKQKPSRQKPTDAKMKTQMIFKDHPR